MSGDSENESTVNPEPSNEATEVAPQVSSEEFAALKAQFEKQNLLIDKLREHEQSSLQREQEAVAKREGDEGEFDAFKLQVNEQLNDVLIESALEKELSLAGARNVEVVKKLVNRQDIKVVNGKADADAIRSTIDGLKESESYMFVGDSENVNPLIKPTATPVARAGEPANEDIVNKELKAATTHAELLQVIEKHNVQ
jgi:hypothetical protein